MLLLLRGVREWLQCSDWEVDLQSWELFGRAFGGDGAVMSEVRKEGILRLEVDVTRRKVKEWGWVFLFEVTGWMRDWTGPYRWGNQDRETEAYCAKTDLLGIPLNNRGLGRKGIAVWKTLFNSNAELLLSECILVESMKGFWWMTDWGTTHRRKWKKKFISSRHLVDGIITCDAIICIDQIRVDNHLESTSLLELFIPQGV